MLLGAIGNFCRYCLGLGPETRWLWDASCWLDLAHVPLVILMQLVVAPLVRPAW